MLRRLFLFFFLMAAGWGASPCTPEEVARMILFNLDDKVIEELCGPEVLPKKGAAAEGSRGEEQKAGEEEKKREDEEPEEEKEKEEKETEKERVVEEYRDQNRSGAPRRGNWSLGVAALGFLHQARWEDPSGDYELDEPGGAAALLVGYGEGEGWGADLLYAPDSTVRGVDVKSASHLELGVSYAFALEGFPNLFPRVRVAGRYQFITFAPEGGWPGEGLSLLGGSAGAGLSYYVGPIHFFVDLLYGTASGEEGKIEYRLEEPDLLAGVRFHFL